MWTPEFRQKARTDQGLPPQTHESWGSPYQQTFDRWEPFSHNIDVFRTIRDAIPFCDVAISKYNKLIGTFEVDCNGNKRAQELADDFIKRVKVNHFDSGFFSWQSQLVDSALETGAGYGEMIPMKSLKDIYRLKNARAKDFRFVVQNSELFLAISDVYGVQPIKIENQDLVFMLTFDKRQGHPQGYSLFESLPFVANILIRIHKTIENQVWRVGDPTMVVWVEPEKEGLVRDYNSAKQATSEIKSQFQTVFKNRRKGQVTDIFAAMPPGSKLNFEILGGDTNIMPLEVPVRTILEQIVAKTGFPPFMLGLSWSTTERLSTHQNDMIINTINGYRSMLDPIIEKVIGTKLIMNGFTGLKWSHTWNDVNLMDEKEKAEARKLDAEAVEKEINSLVTMVEYGWIDVTDAILTLEENGIITKAMKQELGRDGLEERIRNRAKMISARRVVRLLN